MFGLWQTSHLNHLPIVSFLEAYMTDSRQTSIFNFATSHSGSPSQLQFINFCPSGVLVNPTNVFLHRSVHILVLLWIKPSHSNMKLCNVCPHPVRYEHFNWANRHEFVVTEWSDYIFWVKLLFSIRWISERNYNQNNNK